MLSLRVAVATIAVAGMIGATFALSSYAQLASAAVGRLSLASPFTPPPGSPRALLASETAVLTRQGISPARAAQTIQLQSGVGRAELPKKLELAMGRAFAGVWFDNAAAQLHVGVTGSAGERIAQRIAAREGLAAGVTMTRVRSTWQQLLGAQRRWHDRLAHLFAREEVETAISAQGNALLITLSSSIPAAERDLLKREAAGDAVNVFITVAATPAFRISRDASTCEKFAAGEAYCTKPIVSGISIENVNRQRCTAGPMAIPVVAKQETYLLTAGHCIRAGGVNGAWYGLPKFNEARQEIGKGQAGYVNNSGGDYGEIRIARNGYWTEVAAIPITAATAEWLLPEEENVFAVRNMRTPAEKGLDCHEGQSSGESCGEIKHAFVEIAGVKGVVESEMGAGEPEGVVGDSGGPFLFIEGNKEALMEGTTIGSVEEGGVVFGRRLVFEPLGTILEHYGQELLITANEVRPVEVKGAETPALAVCKKVPTHYAGLWNSHECSGSSVEVGSYAWSWPANKDKGTTYCLLGGDLYSDSACEADVSEGAFGAQLFEETFPKQEGLDLLSLLTSKVAGVSLELRCEGGSLSDQPLAAASDAKTTVSLSGCTVQKPASCEVSNPSGTAGKLETKLLDAQLTSLTLLNLAPETESKFLELELKGSSCVDKSIKQTVTGEQKCEFESPGIKEQKLLHTLTCKKSGGKLKLGTEPAEYEGSTDIKTEGDLWWKTR